MGELFLLNWDPSKITGSDLQGVIDKQVIESSDIEYKRNVSIGSKAEERKKIKLLAGIASFANSDGGDFLIGISADAGIPKETTPIECLGLAALNRAAEQ